MLTALSLRHPVLVQVRAGRGERLYRVEADGRVSNHFRLKLANRGLQKAYVTIRPQGLPNATLSIEATFTLQPGQAIEAGFDILAPPGGSRAEVHHFRIVSHATPDNTVDTFETTFLSPIKP